MCAAPTSADSEAAGDADPLALAAAGWSPEELRWERLQEQAAAAACAGAQDTAARLWAEALRLARCGFAANDPRLATSLANRAIALRRTGKDAFAAELLEEALAVWDASAAWVETLRPERRARSSTFHLRLEAKHRGGYEHFSQERYRALATEGRATTLALRRGEGGREAAAERLERWRRERPAGFTDGRRLLAAALLIASAD